MAGKVYGVDYSEEAVAASKSTNAQLVAAGRVEVQHLLMPVILQLTPEQQIEYARIADELHHSGFETEPFGNRTIAVKAAPAAVGQGDLER